jgi:RNA polymerase sigma-70 factor (ECF subfamily)
MDRWSTGQVALVRRRAAGLDQAGPLTPLDFHALYRQQVSYVLRTLRRLGVRPAEIDDLAQEVFTVVFRRLSDYDPSRPIGPWLFGIAFRIVSVHHRARSRRIVEVPADPLELADDEAHGPEASVADRQARRLLLQALDALDLDQRAALVMHDIDGQAVPAIAEALGVPVPTVYSRLRAARARFTSRVRQLELLGKSRGER